MTTYVLYNHYCSHKIVFYVTKISDCPGLMREEEIRKKKQMVLGSVEAGEPLLLLLEGGQ